MLARFEEMGSSTERGTHAMSRARERHLGDDHSSSSAIAGGIKRPTRKPRTGRPLRAPRGAHALPYLVLLRAGFCLPSALRQTRCALTAPFHPYSPSPL